MVCRHNICRSPVAEGLLLDAAKRYGLGRRLKVASAGTHVDVPGQRTDVRAIKVARTMGLKLKKGRSRQVTAADFEKFDYILPMDQDNYQDLLEKCPPDLQYKLALILSFADGAELTDIPDPYYGSLQGFEQVFNLLHSGVEGFILDVALNRED